MQATRGNLTLEIHQDLDPINPREGETNLSIMACWHQRHRLGDSQPALDPDSWLERMQEEYPDLIKLPLYLYSHSGLHLQTMPFTGMNAAWDSGQVGWVFTTRQRCAELGVPWDPDKVRAQLLAEVFEYDQFLSGDVYGFRLLQDGEEVASCWGFFGTDWKSNGLIDHLPAEARELVEVLE